MPAGTSLESPVHYAIEQAVYHTKAQGVIELLAAMGVSLDGITITYNGSQYLFSAQTREAADRLVIALPQFFADQDLDSLKVRKEVVANLVEQEIGNSQCEDDLFKKVCIETFNLIKPMLSYEVHPSQKHIEISFPEAMQAIYVSMFQKLTFGYMELSPEGKLIFNIHKYLQSKPSQDLVLIEHAQMNSILVLNEELIEAKQVYFATRHETETEVTIQPFFRTTVKEAPQCQFILDVSGSMLDRYEEGHSLAGKTKLSVAQESLRSLADVFFELYPDARLSVQAFSGAFGISHIGHPYYTRETREIFYQDLAQVFADGGTPLYEVIHKKVAPLFDKGKCSLAHARGHNIIVFTDGEDDGYDADKAALLRLIEQIQNVSEDDFDAEVRRATNKCSVISCTAKQQPAVLKNFCKQFSSEVKKVEDAQFTTAAGGPDFLAKFLQFRDLLSIDTIITEAEVDAERTLKTLVCQSTGQFIAAPPIMCAKGAEIQFSVKNSLGHTVASEQVKITAIAGPAMPTSSSNTNSSYATSGSAAKVCISNNPSTISYVGGTTRVVASKPASPIPAQSTSSFNPNP